MVYTKIFQRFKGPLTRWDSRNEVRFTQRNKTHMREVVHLMQGVVFY